MQTLGDYIFSAATFVSAKPSEARLAVERHSLRIGEEMQKTVSKIEPIFIIVILIKNDLNNVKI